MADTTDELGALRNRILISFQIQRGSNVWAPWGVSGWSAIEVTKPSRRWAKGYRVKPATNERGAEAKVPLDRLLKRDLKLGGKDKPDLTPDVVFAHMLKPKKAETPEAEEDSEPEEKTVAIETPAPVVAPSPVPSVPPKKEPTPKERAARIARLLALFPPGDMLTTDDW